MLKHWLEAQIQHNRNYESCLVHSCFVLQTQQVTSSYSKLGLTSKLCQLPDGYGNGQKSP